MDSWVTIGVLYGVGLLLLLADFFLPSHGILTLTSLAMLGVALYGTFQLNQGAGLVSLVLLIVCIPTMLALAVRYWPHTWLGKKIAPANPVLTEADRLPVEDLESLIGRTGRSLSPLRPVGMCSFGDRRVECAAETSLIGAGVEVEGVRLSDRTLVVRPTARIA
jgi:membrane-bound ClpP family serine protease